MLAQDRFYSTVCSCCQLAVLEFLNNLWGARNRVGIGLSYRLARLHVLADMINWNRCLGPIKVKKFGLCFFIELWTLWTICLHTCDMFPLDCVHLIFNRFSWPFLSRYLYLWSHSSVSISPIFILSFFHDLSRYFETLKSPGIDSKEYSFFFLINLLT
jgi:hypothetical protein